MIVTFSNIYILYYLINILILFFLSYISSPMIFLKKYNINSYITYLKKYTLYNKLYITIIFLLTGLPPVGLFFVKFTILSLLFKNINIILILIIFIVFFLNMLFYSQIFLIKNYKFSINNLINNNIFSDFKIDNFKSNKNNYVNIKIIIYIYLFILCLIFNINFISDIIIIYI